MAKSTDIVAEALAGINHDSIAERDELNAVTSYQDALKLIGIDQITAENEALLGWDTNPFESVDKSQLIGIPHLIVQWRFIAGDFGEYAIAHAIARLDNGTDWLVLYADGSKSGIYDQLRQLTASRLADGHEHPQQGALIRGGLTESNYEVEGADGSMIAGTTYYLSNSKRKK